MLKDSSWRIIVDLVRNVSILMIDRIEISVDIICVESVSMVIDAGKDISSHLYILLLLLFLFFFFFLMSRFDHTRPSKLSAKPSNSPSIHGDICDLCEQPVLHPFNEQQRQEHRLECLKKHEAKCEEAFAIQRSQDKKCGICLETVWDREGDQRFGMLENCSHIFCLECIRTWRSSSNYEHKVVKACPECRTKSDFVTPTKFWPENDQAKKILIQSYKDNLQ